MKPVCRTDLCKLIGQETAPRGVVFWSDVVISLVERC